MHSAQAALGGCVTAPHHLAAESGCAILRAGGDAIEAAIAAAATIAVVYPHMNAIGGDGFWLIAEPGREPVAIRACGPAAALATREAYRDEAADKTAPAIPARGPRAALTMAGAVGGWAEAKAMSEAAGGKMPIAELLADAIRYAREGAPVTRSQASATAEKWAGLARAPGFAPTYAPDGPPRAGGIMRQSKLADTLQRLAEAGLDDFYRGDLAATLAAGLEAIGSPIRRSDFEAFRAERVAPLRVALSVGHVFNHPPPTQGVSSLMILGLFDRLGVGRAEQFAHVHGLVEATKVAFRLRNAHVGDPRAMTVDPASWLETKALSAGVRSIDPARAAPWPESGGPGDTVWLGAIDRHGCAVSYIQSIYWEFGSGCVIGDTGVVWQNRGAGFSLEEGPNALAPGRMPFHTLNPALAQLHDGRTIVYGCMGGEGQPQTQAAIFTRHALFGHDMQEAISAPRWLLGRTWGNESTTLKLENDFEPELIRALADAGHVVELVRAQNEAMGHAGMASIDARGVIRGATDPRSDGAVATL